MPTKHPKILVTLTAAQRDQLRSSAAASGKTISDLIRDCLLDAGLILPDRNLYESGGLRELWLADDDTALISTTPDGYHVDLTIDDWYREHHDFDTLQNARDFLHNRGFAR